MKIIGSDTEIIGSRSLRRLNAKEMAEALGKCKDYAFFFETEDGIEYKSKDRKSFAMLMTFFKAYPGLFQVIKDFIDEEE